ncbi:LamG domain-containing protein [Pontibacter akesuensis]|nr:LamG domain-containing protein [Pontibacter akesuensis]
MMKGKSAKLMGCCLVLNMLLVGCVASRQSRQEVWQLNSLETISGYTPQVWGQPKVVKAEGKKAIQFDGKEDGLLLGVNPIAGADAFTIEVEFKPAAAYPENVEQRFLHIQDPNNDKRRILIELRLNDKGQWYPDLFMRTENASLTLIDSTRTHPVNKWASIRLAYKDGQLKGYVNGEEELSGEIEYLPISSTAKTSIGTRMDKRSWFNGAIRVVKFSKTVE